MGIIAEHWSVDERVQLSVQRATGASRLRGLIGRRLPTPGSALLLERCRAVHTFGMRAPIDVVFVSHEGVVRSARTLAPRRTACCRSARSTFELAAGEARRLGIAPGARLARMGATA